MRTQPLEALRYPTAQMDAAFPNALPALTQLHHTYRKVEGKGVNQCGHNCTQQKQLAAWALVGSSTPSHCLLICFSLLLLLPVLFIIVIL